MPSIDAYLRAIKAKESTNNYSVLGPTHPKYGRALGAYQVMESNLPSWSQAAVGRQVTPDEFLKNPELQDQIARHRFTQYAEKHGLDNAASMWHSGVPLAQAQARKDVLGTRTPDYVKDIARRAGGDTGVSVDPTQMTQADLPAQGAAEAGGPPTQPGFWEGGPGALFGMPQKDWNAADAMIGVGAALMARDNPSGASALSALATKAKASQGAKSVVKVDSKTGMVTRYDPTTDSFKTEQVFPRSPEADDPTDGNRKMFQDNLSKANAHSALAETMDRARREIATGDIDLSLASKVKQSAAELFNMPLTDQQKRTARFLLDMENARADILRTFPGVQTEGDAKRAMDMLKPGGLAGLSNDNVMEAMERGFAHSTRNYGEQLKYNESLYQKFGTRIAPSDYGDSNAARQRAFAEAEETYKPLKESYVKKRTESTTQKSTEITGRPQDAKAPPTTGMSLYDAFKNRK
jgi:hypothetical protein